MRQKCPRCGGFLAHSRDDDGVVCWNCGRIYYEHPTPPGSTHAYHDQRSRINARTIQQVVQALRDYMQSHQSPFYVRELHNQVILILPYWTITQTRLLLNRKREFCPTAHPGWWVLSSDFEIE